MNFLSKSTLLAAGTALLAASAPAEARYGDRRHDGVDAGDVIAGALIIGGIAAIASAGSNGNRYGQGYGRGYDRSYNRGYDRYGRDDRYNNGYNDNGYGSRQAIDQCVRAAQREASRYGWARVTDVGNIYRVRGGFEVRGRLVVETRGGGYRGGRGGGYDRGYYYDQYNDGYDKGRFSCVTRYDGRPDVRISGLRGSY